MKKIAYISLMFCVMLSCMDNAPMKTQEHNVDALPSVKDGSGIELELLSPESIGSIKLEEYFDLIKLKQEHPEFEDDINLQLETFSEGSIPTINYPKGFTITNVKTSKLGQHTETQKMLKLKFTVTAASQSFQDSLRAIIKSDTIELDGKTRISRTVSFSKMKDN